VKLNILNQAVVNPEFSFRNDMTHIGNTNHIALLGNALYREVGLVKCVAGIVIESNYCHKKRLVYVGGKRKHGRPGSSQFESQDSRPRIGVSSAQERDLVARRTEEQHIVLAIDAAQV
jgi:hypothetical protein